MDFQVPYGVGAAFPGALEAKRSRSCKMKVGLKGGPLTKDSNERRTVSCHPQVGMNVILGLTSLDGVRPAGESITACLVSLPSEVNRERPKQGSAVSLGLLPSYPVD